MLGGRGGRGSNQPTNQRAGAQPTQAQNQPIPPIQPAHLTTQEAPPKRRRRKSAAEKWEQKAAVASQTTVAKDRRVAVPAADTSLALVTRRVLALLKSHPRPLTQVDIRRKLEEGRRVYDAVGVLEGMGAIRRAEAGIEMTPLGRALLDPGAGQPSLQQLSAELESLENAHAQVVAANRTLLTDPTAQEYLYVTYDDILSVFGDQKLIAIRAPAGSVVGIPDNFGTMPPRYEMSLTTKNPDDAVTIVEITSSRT